MEGKTSVTHLKTSEKVLKSVVKLFVQLSTPNYSMPWQMKRQQQSFGSGFIISDKRILTNGHVVAYQKSVRVRKHGDAKKYNAHVIHVGHECDIAMLGVEDDKFWEDLYPLPFGEIPHLEEDVVCVGFPTGGDNISVTRGVVSRVEMQRYAHSAVELLAIQIDAAINSGNSGGPALQDDKLIGIAFETLDNAENIGYIIPVTVINHFLDDIARNKTYYGFCRLGIKWQPIDSEHMRSYFKMTTDQTGILVTKVLNLFNCSGKLIRGDVLMAIDGESVADDGTVPFRGNERILFDYILSNKFVNDSCELSILRQGKQLKTDVRLDKVTALVPKQLYDKRPSFLVFAGLVFVTLSQPYMQHQYGKDWARKAPIRLCERVLYGILEQPDQEVIILSQVLASKLTTGYENLSNLQLYKVNGITILNLKHLASVLDRTTQAILQDPKDDQTDIIQSQEATDSITSSCNHDIESSGTENSNYDALNEREKGSYNDEGCRSPKTRDAIRVSDSVSPICEPRTSINERLGSASSSILPASQTQCRPDKLSSLGFACSFSNRLEGNAGLEEDTTLLSRDDYLHFELDKDKIIVLPIDKACKFSPDILKQYSIGQNRSDDLMAAMDKCGGGNLN